MARAFLYFLMAAISVVFIASCPAVGNHAPIVFAVRAEATTAPVGREIILVADAEDADGNSLTYVYEVAEGDVSIAVEQHHPGRVDARRVRLFGKEYVHLLQDPP